MNTPDHSLQQQPKHLRRSARKNPCATPKKLFAQRQTDICSQSPASLKPRQALRTGSRKSISKFSNRTEVPLHETVEEAFRKELLDSTIEQELEEREKERHSKRLTDGREGLFEVHDTEWQYPRVVELLGDDYKSSNS